MEYAGGVPVPTFVTIPLNWNVTGTGPAGAGVAAMLAQSNRLAANASFRRQGRMCCMVPSLSMILSLNSRKPYSKGTDFLHDVEARKTICLHGPSSSCKVYAFNGYYEY